LKLFSQKVLRRLARPFSLVAILFDSAFVYVYS